MNTVISLIYLVFNTHCSISVIKTKYGAPVTPHHSSFLMLNTHELLQGLKILSNVGITSQISGGDKPVPVTLKVLVLMAGVINNPVIVVLVGVTPQPMQKEAGCTNRYSVVWDYGTLTLTVVMWN